jgi:hypothetical protein
MVGYILRLVCDGTLDSNLLGLLGIFVQMYVK